MITLTIDPTRFETIVETVRVATAKLTCMHCGAATVEFLFDIGLNEFGDIVEHSAGAGRSTCPHCKFRGSRVDTVTTPTRYWDSNLMLRKD